MRIIMICFHYTPSWKFKLPWIMQFSLSSLKWFLHETTYVSFYAILHLEEDNVDTVYCTVCNHFNKVPLLFLFRINGYFTIDDGIQWNHQTEWEADANNLANNGWEPFIDIDFNRFRNQIECEIISHCNFTGEFWLCHLFPLKYHYFLA